MDKRVSKILEAAIAINVRHLLEGFKNKCAGESDTATTLSDYELDKGTYECMRKIIDDIEHWEKTKQIERIEIIGEKK